MRAVGNRHCHRETIVRISIKRAAPRLLLGVRYNTGWRAPSGSGWALSPSGPADPTNMAAGSMSFTHAVVPQCPLRQLRSTSKCHIFELVLTGLRPHKPVVFLTYSLYQLFTSEASQLLRKYHFRWRGAGPPAASIRHLISDWRATLCFDRQNKTIIQRRQSKRDAKLKSFSGRIVSVVLAASLVIATVLTLATQQMAGETVRSLSGDGHRDGRRRAGGCDGGLDRRPVEPGGGHRLGIGHSGFGP